MNNIRNQLEKIIIELTFEQNKNQFINTLNMLLFCQNGYAKLNKNDEILCENKNLNYRCGFVFESDPVTKSVMIASVLVGASQWMIIFPNLLREVNKKWGKSKPK
jgi:hypothetical protein